MPRDVPEVGGWAEVGGDLAGTPPPSPPTASRVITVCRRKPVGLLDRGTLVVDLFLLYDEKDVRLSFWSRDHVV